MNYNLPYLLKWILRPPVEVVAGIILLICLCGIVYYFPTAFDQWFGIGEFANEYR